MIFGIPAGGGGGGIPSGLIAMWSGAASAIPDGWALCDGSNGTPDLRGKFALGSSDKYAVGATGGEETHTLTVNEMPSHNHSYKHRQSGRSTKTNQEYGGDHYGDLVSDTSGTAGGSQAHNNMPPYYALCYIIKL